MEDGRTLDRQSRYICYFMSIDLMTCTNKANLLGCLSSTFPVPFSRCPWLRALKADASTDFFPTLRSNPPSGYPDDPSPLSGSIHQDVGRTCREPAQQVLGHVCKEL